MSIKMADECNIYIYITKDMKFQTKYLQVDA